MFASSVLEQINCASFEIEVTGSKTISPHGTVQLGKMISGLGVDCIYLFINDIFLHGCNQRIFWPPHWSRLTASIVVVLVAMLLHVMGKLETRHRGKRPSCDKVVRRHVLHRRFQSS